MARSIRVVLVERDPLAAAALTARLETAGVVIAHRTADPTSVSHADVVAVEAVLWGASWAIETLVREMDALAGLERPIAAIVHDDVQAAVAWSLGASAVLPRDIAASSLAAALHACSLGLRVAGPVAGPTRGCPLPGDEAIGRPTPSDAERRVHQLLVEGLSDKVIARRLGLSEPEVSFLACRVRARLGARSRTDVALRDRRTGPVAL